MLLLLVLSLLFGSVTAGEAQEVPQSRAAITLSFAPVVKAAAPAVVNVTSESEGDPLYANDPFMRRFFEGHRPRRGTSALGSGVIVDPSGVVVTNVHVIKNAKTIRVGLNDRREYDAELLLKDERTDLAVLKIEGDGPFPYVTLGDASSLEVGDLVLAIGNPFGVGQTVTQGIVSATARTQVGIADARFFIQTDAAINPGNSGGALIDMAGHLVGINTAIYSRSGGSIGIGFAIPVDMVRIVIQSAENGGVVRRPWLGARLETVTSDLARQLGLDRASGAVVVSLVPDGPAAASGLQVGDVVSAIDGLTVTDLDSFAYLFATRGVSGDAELTYSRDGEDMTTTVDLTLPPETVPRDPRTISGRNPFSGSVAMNLSPALADELNLDIGASGVVLARVDASSVANRLGLRARDIVRSVNGVAVEDTATLEELGKRRLPYWDIVIERDGHELSLVLGG